MAFYKKAFNKSKGSYYPQAIVQGKPVSTETIAAGSDPGSGEQGGGL